MSTACDWPKKKTQFHNQLQVEAKLEGSEKLADPKNHNENLLVLVFNDTQWKTPVHWEPNEYD